MLALGVFVAMRDVRRLYGQTASRAWEPFPLLIRWSSRRSPLMSSRHPVCAPVSCFCPRWRWCIASLSGCFCECNSSGIPALGAVRGTTSTCSSSLSYALWSSHNVASRSRRRCVAGVLGPESRSGMTRIALRNIVTALSCGIDGGTVVPSRPRSSGREDGVELGSERSSRPWSSGTTYRTGLSPQRSSRPWSSWTNLSHWIEGGTIVPSRLVPAAVSYQRSRPLLDADQEPSPVPERLYRLIVASGLVRR
jgi:hypothetical protein